MRLIHAAFLATLLTIDLTTGSEDVASAEPVAQAEAPALAALQGQTEDILSQLGVAGAVSGRVKSSQSLHAKAARKGLRPDQVLDRVGLRVLVDAPEDCYAVHRALLARYPIQPDSEDDYIAQPKANGYQSLHLAAHTPFGLAEFQIRTHEMHSHAEQGAAAHWRYKQASAA
jgi:(p)ppGpp synthase/HD superfamily hydrolase